jgi:aldose 1-epimerase
MAEHYGRLGDEEVQAITLDNGQGLTARLITYGARLTELWVPDRTEVPADIVLGHDTLAEYEESKAYFGATVGRYGNRIARGRLRLDGEEVQLDVNEGRNHLHGGARGFDRRNWTLEGASATWATFTLVSEDGDMGYPGRVEASATYEVTPDGLLVTMEATTDQATPFNMVHHSYFNLAGQGSGHVLAQEMRLDAPFYTPVDGELLATGEIRSVEGTPFDLRERRPIGRDLAILDGVGGDVFGGAGGYDHNWCLAGAGEEIRFCAEVVDPASGRRLALRTDQPGVQVYTGGYLSDSVRGKRGARLCPFAGFTLETQKFPGSPNHAHFPPAVLRPDEPYLHRMVFGLTADA